MVALDPAYTPEKSASRSQNRVGDFFVGNGDRVGFDQSASRIVIAEKYDASSRMSSGHSNFASGTNGNAQGSPFAGLSKQTINDLRAYNAELDSVYSNYNPSGSALADELALQALELVADHGVIQASVSGGLGFGGNLGFSLDKSGFKFDWGLGIGVGAGGTVTVGAQFGESHATNVNFDFGNGAVGATFSGGLDNIFESIDQGLQGSFSSSSPSVPVKFGAGYGVGFGWSVTSGGSVDLIKF